MIRVYVVTEVRSYREALVRVLDQTGRVEIVGSAGHPADAQCDLERIEADVALLDVPGAEGPTWARALGVAAPAVRLIVLGLGEAEDEVVAWAEAGIAGYVGREACLEELLAAIEGVMRGAAPCPASTVSLLLRRISAGPEWAVSNWAAERHLTAREREIVRLIAQGLSNQQIARHLHIALATVKNHVHNILEKLGVHGRLEAVREVRRGGFVRRPASIDDPRIVPGLRALHGVEAAGVH